MDELKLYGLYLKISCAADVAEADKHISEFDPRYAGEKSVTLIKDKIALAIKLFYAKEVSVFTAEEPLINDEIQREETVYFSLLNCLIQHRWGC